MGSRRRRRPLKRIESRPLKTVKPWQIRQYDDVDSMLREAPLLVPQELAIRFADALDSGSIEVGANAIFPADWTHRMRCVEFYPEALAWVMSQCKPFEGPQFSIALTNTVRMVCFAAIAVERSRS